MKKYEVIEKIGEGAYGIVLKCKCNDPDMAKRKNTSIGKDSNIVAMKQFKDSDDNEIVKRTTMREVKILKMLNHPNIVWLKQAFRKKGHVYLIFEYARNNLLEVIQKSVNGLDPQFIRYLIYQLIKGIAYLHSLNIIHRDIKPENLLISEDNDLKICDFGFARVLKKNDHEDLTDYVATRWYRAPELLVGSPYHKQIDMWAIGCIMGELIDSNPMFPGQNEIDQLFLIQKCLGPLTNEHNQILQKNPRFIDTKFPEITNLQTIDKRYLGKFNSQGIHLIKNLLKMNPKQRLTASQALKHPFFEGLEQQERIRNKMVISMFRNESSKQKNSYTEKKLFADKKRNGSIPFQATIYHSTDRQTTDVSQSTRDSIFNATKANMFGVNKKRKEDNFMRDKINSNYISTVSKSLGKKSNPSVVFVKDSGPKHISLQKPNLKNSLAQTMKGFYLSGGSIIPERNDEDIDSSQLIQPQAVSNKIYNLSNLNSKSFKSKQSNIDTDDIIIEETETLSPTEQFPFRIMVNNKSSESKHRKVNKMLTPNKMIVPNTVLNFKHI